jgi:hypothetical protein
MLLIVSKARAAGSSEKEEPDRAEPASLHPDVGQHGKAVVAKALNSMTLPDLTQEDLVALRQSRMGQTQLHNGNDAGIDAKNSKKNEVDIETS